MATSTSTSAAPGSAGQAASTSHLTATLVLRAPSLQQTAQAHDQAAAAQTQTHAPAPAPAPAPKAAPQQGSTQPAAHPAAPAAPASPASPAAEAPHLRPGAAPTLVSVAELRAIMTHLSATKANAYITPLNQAMVEFEINVRLRKAAFLGQVAHESGELQWFQEFASGREYDISVNPKKARELGNVNPGDGPRYKGRGPIQLTGRNNYRACGKALQLDLEGHPEIAIQPSVAFRTAGWFWSTHGLNALADKSDYRTITRRINGGYTHYAERVVFYDRALTVFPAAPHA